MVRARFRSPYSGQRRAVVSGRVLGQRSPREVAIMSTNTRAVEWREVYRATGEWRDEVVRDYRARGGTLDELDGSAMAHALTAH